MTGEGPGITASGDISEEPLLVFKPRILRSNKVRFEFVLGSFFNTLPVFSITYWLRSYIFCIFLGLPQASGHGPFLCPSAFRGAIPPPGRMLHGKAHYLSLIRAFGAQIRVRFEFVSQFHPVFSITYWLRSYYFCVFPSLLRVSECEPLPTPSTFGRAPSRQDRCLMRETHSFGLVRTFVTPGGNDGNRRQGLRHRKHETGRIRPFEPNASGLARSPAQPHTTNCSPSYKFCQVPRKLTAPDGTQNTRMAHS